jgi:tetratricopeptide (TPR) repeat protein
VSNDVRQTLDAALRDLQEGRPEHCLEVCDRVLAENPGLSPAHYLRGNALYEMGKVQESVADLDIAWRSQPDNPNAAYYLGRSLRASGRFEEAIEPLEAAVADHAFEAVARYELATCLNHVRRRSEAVEQYLALLDKEQDHAQAAANLSSLLERENRLDEADQWATRALSLEPDNETAQMARAVIDRRSGRLAEAETRLRGLSAKVSHPVNRSIVFNQLGQCLDSMGEWDEAFESFRKSNQILKSHHPAASPNPADRHSLETMAVIQDWLVGKPISDWKPAPPDEEGGIAFLLGFPRSGSTLLDRILSAHPDIEVLEEKGLFSEIHQEWSNRAILEALTQVNEQQILDARGIYRKALARYRQEPGRRLVIDKLPLNLAWIFLINRIFPDAPIIFLRRHPLDACLSCYFQAFELEASMPYFLELGDTAAYYDAVMNLAVESLVQAGNPRHEIRYESLVSDLEQETGKVLSFLGLQWSDEVLKYRERDQGEASNTPSYQQVAQPVYQHSVGRWRNYARHLEPIIPVLEPWVKSYRD